MATRPGFVSNAGGAAFGNPNITAQGQRAGATQAIPAPSGAGAGRGGQGGPTAAQLASVGNSTPPSTPSTGPNTKPTYNDDIGLPDTHYNPLQNYRNMTYNTRLTMMPLAETTLTRLERSYDYKNGIVMWETGGAGSVFLEELQIAVAGTKNATGNYYTQQPTSISGKIVEPVGGRLIESLSLSAMNLGYSTNGIAIYLLEVWFTGYNTDSDMPEVCKGWEGEELIFRWYIRLDELHMKLDYKGATYDFKAVPNDGAAVLNDHYTLEDGFRMTDGPNTIAQFCTFLAKALNDREAEKVKSGLRCIPHKYVISAHKDITNLTFSYSLWQNVTSLWGMIPGEIQGTPGQTIQQFITNSMPNSPNLLKFLHRVTDGKKEYNATDTNPASIHLPMKTLAIIPGCKDIAYDEKLGHSAKEVHYFLTTREDATAVVSPQEYKDSEDPKNRDKRVDNWIKKGLLRKVYKWIYTGENIEVINTEIKIDNMWRSVRPLWIDKDGKPIQGTAATSIPGKQSAGKSSSKTVTCAAAQTVQKPPATKATSYMEDLLYRPTAPREGWHPTQAQWYHMNTTVQQGSNQGALSVENAQEYSIYRQVANGMSGGGELVKLDLEVVGDPYWLMQIPGTPGKPQPWEDDVWEYEKEQLTEEKMAEKRKSASTHTWLGAFYFEAQVPSADNGPDDTMALRKSDAITGIYWPYTIVNRFQKGKFTTKLTANRDVLANPWKKDVATSKPNDTKTGKGSATSAGPTTAATPGGRP